MFLHGSFTSIHLKLLAFKLLLGNLFLFWFFSRSFAESLFFFDQSQFNVAWRAHVWVNTTVSTICSSSHFWCTVYLNVVNDEMIGIQALVLSIGFCVLQKVK